MWSDIFNAVKVFLLVFLSIFPVIVPFIFVKDPYSALKISNVIALILLYWMGRELGRYAGTSPKLWGLCMALIGALLVSITIALGG